MALKPQRLSQLKELLAAGFIRGGTVQGELFNPDGTPFVVGGSALPKAAAVPNAAGSTPTKAEFDALLTSLRNAGYLAT